MYACLAVTCHLHFWQNDRDFLRATVVTRGWNGYRNKSQHRKSTLEKKILPPFQQGFEPATFQSRVRRSNHWAIPAPITPLTESHLFTTLLTESHLFTPLLIQSHLFTTPLTESHLFTTLLTESHLFTTLLTEVGIVAIQQLPFYKLVQRVLQGGVLHRQVQGNERLFSLIPEKWKHKVTLLPRDKSNCEKTREGHCQSDEHWNHFKGIAGETSERQGGAPVGFSGRIDTILNWTELTLRTFSWFILKTGKYRFDYFLILPCDLENGSKLPRFTWTTVYSSMAMIATKTFKMFVTKV